MRCSLRLAAWGLIGLVSAIAGPPRLRGHPRPAAPRGDSAAVAAQSPDSTPPANVSHGEAPVGGPDAAPAPVDASSPRERTRLHRVRLEIQHVISRSPRASRMPHGRSGAACPGRPCTCGQGDTVDFTLVNRANIPHSMDFHAAEIAPSKYYVNVLPGDSLHYRFVARVPGAFMYHCGTAPVAMHIANGMYGALIVDPATPRPRAKEFVLVQSEFYLGPSPARTARTALDWAEALGLAPDHVVFNGRASQYAEHPLDVAAGELVRL